MGQFTNLEKTLSTNLATNRGLVKIVSQIKYYIESLPHIGTAFPKTWADVRKTLEKDSRNYISYDEFLSICEQNGVTEPKDKFQLSSFLHNLGVCLHFHHDLLLKKILILKPEWGTEAVYAALDNKKLINSFGKFNRADLPEIWNDEKYANMQDELLKLMINFQLCYKIPETNDTYILPQLLSENIPKYRWPKNNNIMLRYKYEFIPKGIISRFIVVMNNWISDQRFVWKTGVILNKDKTAAEVIEYDDKREIRVRISGKHKKEMMTVVSYELDKIHNSYKHLKYQKLIPCNCKICINSQEPHFYLLNILQQFKADKQNYIQCQRSYQMVDILALIDDKQENIEKRPKSFDVFLAHNAEDKSIIEKICQILRNRGLKPWFDKEQIPSGSYFQNKIKDALRKANSVAIFIGKQGIVRWQGVEVRSVIRQCMERKIPVMPVLLPGVYNIPDELTFLREFNFVQFENDISDINAIDHLIWGITGKHPKI